MNPIEHVIVLMLENRSYDHILGYLPNGHGLAGNEFNRIDPSDPTSEQVPVKNTADYISPDPAHDFISVEKQLYGPAGQLVDPAPMSGFVAVQTGHEKGDVEQGKKIMECFDPVRIPTMAALAREFCVCDRWFSAVPGPTWVNRFFAHAATSDGMVIDTVEHDYGMKTIYNSLEENGKSWSVYYGDIPQAIILQRLWPALDHFIPFDQFYADVEKGELAAYSFIEPRFINFLEWKANDQHPPHDVRLGEYLIAEIYDTLRSSPLWEKSLLVVTYDEHGGFFDHVPPPSHALNPDGKVSPDPAFDFTRLGVRVPTVLISPWVEKGSVDSTVYEHSSLPATLKTLFNLPNYLTERDKAANTFEKNLSRTTPRRDAPLTLPVPGDPLAARFHRALLRTDVLGKWRRGEGSQTEISHEPLSTFQQSLVELTHRLNKQAKATPPKVLIHTEHEAAVHIFESLARFLER